MILPSEFIELAEETGLIVKIGEWMLKEACLQTRRWHADGYRNLRLAANLSARQLQDPRLPGMVKRILHETGLESQDLNLINVQEQTLARLNATAGRISSHEKPLD